MTHQSLSRAFLIASLAALLAGCGGASEPYPETPEPEVDENGSCKVVDSVKATALPAPQEKGCIGLRD